MFCQLELNTHLFKLGPPTTITRDEDADNSIIEYVRSLLFVERLEH